jgi:hypothetical protein
MLRVGVLVLSFLLLTTGFSFAANEGLTSILKDGIGLRALSMGGAFTAVADDPSAVFYNPAGQGNQNVGYLKGYEDLNYQESSNYEHTFFVANGMGFGFWQKTDLNGKHNEVFAYSIARGGGEGVSYGITYKVARSSSADAEVLGYSYDVGIMGRISPRLRWGVLFQDLIETMGVSGSVRAGLVYKLFPTVLCAMDVEFRNLTAVEGPVVYTHLGMENTVTRGLLLRVGYDRDRWTGGLSASIEPITIEYALIAAAVSGRSGALQLIGFKWAM